MLRGRATALVALEVKAKAGGWSRLEELISEAFQIITAVLGEATAGAFEGARVILGALNSLVEVLDGIFGENGGLRNTETLAVKLIATASGARERIAGCLICKVAFDVLPLLANRSSAIEASGTGTCHSRSC